MLSGFCTGFIKAANKQTATACGRMLLSFPTKKHRNNENSAREEAALFSDASPSAACGSAQVMS